MSTAVDHDRTVPRRPPLLALGLAVVAFLVLVGLGTWQVKRLAWKEALIDTIEARIAAPPLPLLTVEAQYARTGDVDYLPVQATGRFLHDGESHFFATYQGQTGFYVYTPFDLGGGRVVLVNRGFVPYDRKDPATRAEGQFAWGVTISGLARNPLPGKPSSLLPDNEPDKNVFYWKDREAMIANAVLPAGEEVLPFFIDMGQGSVPGGLPVGGVTLVSLPNNHLQYAVTWYGLALALAGVCGAMLWRGRRPPSART